MTRTKIAISLDSTTIENPDRLVARAAFRSRGHAIEIAVREKLGRLDRSRPARECERLDPAFEKALAEEGLAGGTLAPGF